MNTQTFPRLAATEIAALDPYAFFAVLGKRLIHPGGRRATEELLQRAEVHEGQQVLDVGCGVATTAIEIARRFGGQVTAVDIAPLMLARAQANSQAAGLEGKVVVEHGDIMALRFPVDAFDRVIAEAVTMFVDRPRAARELIRVCRPGGRVLATEFFWRKPPTAEARRIFLGEVCPGMRFDTLDDWISLYQAAGLSDIQVTSGPFEMMTPSGFLNDEGFMHCLAIMGHVLSRWSHLRKMAWLMPRMARAVPYLGYIVVAGVKSA